MMVQYFVSNPLFYSFLLVVCLQVTPTEAGVVFPSMDGQLPGLALPDSAGGMRTTTTSTLTVSGSSLIIADVNLILDDLNVKSISDYQIDLTSPLGTTVTLIESAAGSGILSSVLMAVHFDTAVIDDEALNDLETQVVLPNDSNSPFSANVDHTSVGNSPLSIFDGQNAVGNWTLTVFDEAPGDDGTLNGWSLEITAVPEPSSFVFLSLLAIGVVTWRKISSSMGVN